MKKKTILSIMDFLEKINDSIIRNIDIGVQVSMETLVDCQDSAIAVGNEIEQQYSVAGEETVHLLEAYCENLYQMSSKAEDIAFCRKLGKKIQKQLVEIKNHVKYDLPDDKKEVVFLPYKASMWDSLESVWRAADADPDCNAYVIPIPYFDKNPDGSFREEHYEGDLYPKDVPVTRYDEYDLEACHPDVIYIHNPYDECNHVTSVHPYFYSKNLRNFTDKLVYIPYFILGEIEPDDQAAIDGMKHFCFTPGTIYAHQVIVQSENMRQIYINEYIKAAKEMGLPGEHVDRKFLEKKFLGTGSPKIDKVLNTKKEEMEIPAEWLKIIEKPDGSFKKIVFYNTSVSALLQHSEKMLQKMESVFAVFKENKDEVALLWRPHPLIQATIESMRPQLWEEYRELKDKYVAEGWGIYDDSADVDRTVILSDAYYGDGSSVVQLCKKAGMPVMVQDIEILDKPSSDKDGYINIVIIDAATHEDKIWLVARDFNCLFSIDIMTQKIKMAGIFPGEAAGTVRLYESMKIVGEKIYFAPFYAKSIAVFNISKNEFSNITLDEDQIGCSLSRPLFGGMEIYGRFIYMMPTYSKSIVRIDTDSGKVTYITGWDKDVKGLIFNEKDVYFRRQVALVGNKIMAPFCNANAVLELNCETMEYKIHKLGIGQSGYSGICYEGTSYWLSPRKASGNLVRWNKQINGSESVKICQGEEQNLYSYAGVLSQNKDIIVFPAFDKESRVEMDGVHIIIPKGKYVFVKQDGDIIMFYREDTGVLTMDNNKNGKKFEVKIEAMYVDMMTLIKDKTMIICEKKNLDIRDLIGALKTG